MIYVSRDAGFCVPENPEFNVLFHSIPHFDSADYQLCDHEMLFLRCPPNMCSRQK